MSNAQVAKATKMAQDGLDKDVKTAREYVLSARSELSDAKENERKARATATELEAAAKEAQEDYACLRLFRIENTDESELAEVNWSAEM